jgi:probable HAF family extracellular repeat protein
MGKLVTVAAMTAAMAWVVGAAPAAATETYNIIDLGALEPSGFVNPHLQFSEGPMAVGADNAVFGESTDSSVGMDAAFGWQQASGLQQVPARSDMDGANAFGVFAGSAGPPIPGNPTGQSAFTYVPGVGMATLASLPNAVNASAVGINNSGQVAGTTIIPNGTGGGDYHATLWRADGTPVDLRFLKSPVATNVSEARYINDLGEVVGISNVGNGTTIHTHAFFWTPAHGMVDLNATNANIGGAANVAPVGLNDAGQVLLRFEGGGQTYWLWTPGQGAVVIPGPGNVAATARALNDNGQVVGWYQPFVNGPTAPFIWSAATGGITLSGLPNADNRVALGINDAGLVSGSDLTTGDAFTWSAASGYQDLGALPNGMKAFYDAVQVTDSGMIAVDGNNNYVHDSFVYVPTDRPGAPGSVVATAGNQSAQVAFDPPAANGSSISSYTVTAYDQTTPANGLEHQTGVSSPITVGGLTKGDSYRFIVVATNAAGAGPPAGSQAVVIEGPPGPPTAVNAIAGTDSAKVSFAPPLNAYGASVLSYTVTSSAGQVASGSASPITVRGLAAGSLQTFTVTATNVFGTGPASKPSKVVTILTPQPDGSGTAVVLPTSVVHGAKGRTLSFTYKASLTAGTAGGIVQVVIPPGWSSPDTSPTAPGAVHTTLGTLSVAGQIITVSGLNLNPAQAFKIVYGWKLGGGLGATVPTVTGPDVFEVREASTPSGTLTDIAVEPTVTVT